MPRTVTIASGHYAISLPNNLTYNAGQTAILSDEEFARIVPSLLGTIIVDGGEVGGSSGGSSGDSTEIPTQAFFMSGLVPGGGVTNLTSTIIPVPWDRTNPGNYVSSTPPCHMGSDNILVFDQTGTYCLTFEGAVSNATNRPTTMFYGIGNGDFVARNTFQHTTDDQLWLYSRTFRVMAGDTFSITVRGEVTPGDSAAVSQLIPGLCFLNVDRVGN